MNAARLMELDGRGYAVVESLPALGKGLSCKGIFVAEARHRARLEAAWRARGPVPFRGMAHYRQLSREVELHAEIERVGAAAEGKVTVEFLVRTVPRDLFG